MSTALVKKVTESLPLPSQVFRFALVSSFLAIPARRALSDRIEIRENRAL